MVVLILIFLIWILLLSLRRGLKNIQIRRLLNVHHPVYKWKYARILASAYGSPVYFKNLNSYRHSHRNGCSRNGVILYFVEWTCIHYPKIRECVTESLLAKQTENAIIDEEKILLDDSYCFYKINWRSYRDLIIM